MKSNKDTRVWWASKVTLVAESSIRCPEPWMFLKEGNKAVNNPPQDPQQRSHLDHMKVTLTFHFINTFRPMFFLTQKSGPIDEDLQVQC